MPHVEVQIPGRPPFNVPLGHLDLIVGRGDGAGIRIPEAYVSGRHTLFALRVFARDLGSTNGTLYKGARLTEQYLTHGDVLNIGGPDGAKLRLVLTSDTPPAAAEAAADATMKIGTAAAAGSSQEADNLRAELRQRGRDMIALDENLRAKTQEIERLAKRLQELEARPPAGDSPETKKRIDALETELEYSKRLVDDLKRSLQSAQPKTSSTGTSGIGGGSGTASKDGDAGNTLLLAQVAELQEKLKRAQKAQSEAESKAAVLAKSGFSGAQEAIALVQEKDKEIASLRQSLNEASRRSAPPGATAAEGATAGPAAAGQGSAFEMARSIVETFSTVGGVGLEEPLREMMQKRPELFADTGFALGKMYRFSRDLESVVTRMAQLYRGGASAVDETMIPGISGNLSRSVHSLLLKGGERPRKELEAYLESLRVWAGICLTAYKTGGRQWVNEIMAKISPEKIQRTVQVGGMKKLFGMEGWEFWKAYKKQMEDVTPNVAEAQIDEFAAKAAVEMAKKQGVF